MRAFRELAEVFQKLEHTSSNSALVSILAAFLSKLNPDEAKAVAYLLGGEVAAPFETQEIGMAERMAMRAVAEAYSVSEQRVERLLSTAGDLGTAAENLAGAKRGRAAAILHVFDQLKKIARISGKGSQHQKCARLAQLLFGASGVEAKYILRTVLGSHRIGVADMTFLRALAKAYTGGTENKDAAEAAYNVLPDLGEISHRMARSGLAGLRRVVPVPETPVRMMLASRVQNLDEVPQHMPGKMFIEYKYDGERVQIHRDGKGDVQAFSRRLERITQQYPEIIDALKKVQLSQEHHTRRRNRRIRLQGGPLAAVSNAHAAEAQARRRKLYQESTDCSVCLRLAARPESEPARSTARGATPAARALHQIISHHTSVKVPRELRYCRR